MNPSFKHGDAEKKESSFVSLPQLLSDEEKARFESQTMRSVDLHIIPIVSLLYSFALIDRINLGAARTAGMGPALASLHFCLEIDACLTNSLAPRNWRPQSSIATVMYFIPYILLQIPGNLVVRKFGARNYLTFCAVGWGAVQLGMAFVPTWGYLTFCRVLLGLFEASFFPGIFYIISSWYTRYEVQKRLAFFYLMSLTISGFSPILAYVFSLLDGKRGIAGWSWIFIIEGAITLFIGLAAFFLLPDFPEQNTFLTPEQTAFVLQRVEDDRGDSVPEQITLRKVLHHLGDWTLWAYGEESCEIPQNTVTDRAAITGLMFMCCTLPAYALAYFISIILKGMGWSTTDALLLSAPPYAPAFLSAVFFAWLSDKYRHRAGFIGIQGLISITGLCLTAFSTQNRVRYFGIFLLNAGSSGCIPSILAYSANNVVGSSKRRVHLATGQPSLYAARMTYLYFSRRSIASALTVAFGGVGGIIASTVYREQDFPRYLPGLWVTLGAQFLLLFLVGMTSLHFTRLNRLARAGKLAGPLEGQPGFFYTL
ncbi:High-affinity nicotinic acid transporter [Mycena venus]|uniref:High-affinity nicotinic acid transporter n=1 Tax=Mycena venus TaxID=2733690 RepID=A0A8H6YJB0_9AGAR|nr:High-affinity nicotinic acid transporter [Mycena venus]